MKEKNHGNVNFVIIGKNKNGCGISLTIMQNSMVFHLLLWNKDVKNSQILTLSY